MKNGEKRKLDIALLILFPILAAIASLMMKADFLVSTLLFFGPISVLLSYRNQKAIKKTLVFSMIFSVPFAIIVDYIATVSQAWYVPETIFPSRFLNVIPIEDFIWAFMLVYSIIIFYERFFDKTGKEIMSKRIRFLGWILSSALFLFFVVLFAAQSILYVKYAYFWMGVILFLAPTIIFLLYFPNLLAKYVKTGAYFFFLFLLLELTGLHLDQWRFPSDHFIGWVELFGHKFPFEEFFFFIMISAVVILSYYEFFDDDRK